MAPTPDKNSDTTERPSSTANKEVARIKSADLLRRDRRLIIEHRGEDYCLRVTRNKRLILTKL